MIKPSSAVYRSYIKGIKTGSTQAAGRNFVSAAVNDKGETYTGVVLGAPWDAAEDGYAYSLSLIHIYRAALFCFARKHRCFAARAADAHSSVNRSCTSQSSAFIRRSSVSIRTDLLALSQILFTVA